MSSCSVLVAVSSECTGHLVRCAIRGIGDGAFPYFATVNIASCVAPHIELHVIRDVQMSCDERANEAFPWKRR
jgi:hypothetical protein